MTKERPILFKTEMVRAILSGQKTQTRRILKEPRKDGHVHMGFLYRHKRVLNHLVAVLGKEKDGCTTSLHIKSPYGHIGDRLWVREKWNNSGSPFSFDASRELPSTNMPRAASRILLEIVNVRIERLKDISRGDCMAEGCPFRNIKSETDPVQWFSERWKSICGAGSWDQNPWVWVYEFKKVKGDQ